MSKERPVPAVPPPLPNIRKFQGKLLGFLRTWRRGMFSSSILWILSWFLIGVAAFALIDFYLATENRVRTIAVAALVLAVVVGILWELGRVFQLGRPDIARRIDRLSGNRRRPVLSALELLRERERSGRSATDLQRFLEKRSIEEANLSLKKQTAKEVFPRELFRKSGGRFLLVAGVFAVLTVALWPVASVLLGRLAQPQRDIPPYSPLAFAVSPEQPEIFYGDDATVTAEITGGDLTEPVRFLTRDGGEVFETVCFQDGPNRFAQRLERVVKPTEFAFAHGRARSHWHRIDLLMEPKVALASVTVTPPEYASRPGRTFLIGEEPLAALRGSWVKLSITSNRPLFSGNLSIRPPGADELATRNVEGSKTGPQTVSFEWKLKEEADLEVEIRDIRGTPSRESLRIAQRLVPDKPPKIEITKPELHLMATPSIRVPVQARAEDDLGLGRVELARTVVGYRDRLEDVSPAGLERRYDYQSDLSLGDLGVRPGETLELYFQAIDRNPSLLGIAASEVARIQIISDEEYANIIRTRTTIKEFAERFRIVNEHLQQLREAAEELRKALEAGDGEKAEAARARAAEAAEQAGKLFEMLSDDFAAFDLEEAAIEHAADTLKDIRALEELLKEGGEGLSAEALEQLLKKLGMHQKESESQLKNADEIAAVAKVMEMAAEFAAIVRDQDNLTRRLKQFEKETRAGDLPFLKALGEDQERIRERLDEFALELRDRVGQLPPGYDALAEGATRFAEEVEKSKAGEDMDTSSGAAEEENGGKSWQYSSLALEKLQDLMQAEGECEAFSSMCNGELKFPLPASMNKTLSQMLSAVGLRMGAGFGGDRGSGAGGMGLGGGSEDGYSMAGYTALDIPVVGPPRMRLQGSPLSRLAGGESDAVSKNGRQTSRVSESDRIALTGQEATATTPLDLDRVPEKYRDAVKRYFTPE